MQDFKYFYVYSKIFEMKKKYFCKYDKSYVVCIYETGDEHRDLLQREILCHLRDFVFPTTTFTSWTYLLLTASVNNWFKSYNVYSPATS